MLIFHLLMEGTHPFAGVYLEDGDPPPFEERIARGHFAYGNRVVPYRPNTRYAPPFEMLPPNLRELFVLCFEAGHDNPDLRPDARTWQRALDEAGRQLSRCAANPQHLYSNHLDACPWCLRQLTQLRGLDPFPSEQAVLEKSKTPSSAPKVSSPAPYTDGRQQAPPPATSTPSTYELVSWLTMAGGLALLCLFVVLANSSDTHHPYTMDASRGEPFTPITASGTTRKSLFPMDGLTVTPDYLETVLSVDPVTRVAYSSDGKTIVGGGNPIVVWNANTYKMRHKFVAGDIFKWRFACSPNGKTLAAGDKSHVIVRDSETGKERHRFELPDDDDVILSHDGRLLATCSWKPGSPSLPAITVWSVKTGAKLRQFGKPMRSWPTILFSPADDTLIYATGAYRHHPAIDDDKNNSIEAWNARTGKRQWRLRNLYPVEDLQFSRDGKTLLAGGLHSQRWSVKTGLSEALPAAYSLSGYGFTFSPTGDRVANRLIANDIEVRDTTTGKRLFVLPLVSYSGRVVKSEANSPVGYMSMDFSPNGNTLITGSSSHGAQVWNAHTGKLLYTLDTTADTTHATPSGLRYKDLKTGTGAVPRIGQKLTVHYVGMFTDGTESYSVDVTNKPFTFTLGEHEVISGLEEGIATMHIGGKRRLTVPPNLAYGSTGDSGSIPSNTTLIFDVELLQAQDASSH